MKKLLVFSMLLAMAGTAFSQGLKIGDKAVDFKLKNVNGKYVTLSDYSKEKGVVLIFTCNHCPYAKAYEDRIIELHNAYASKGFPVVAINPNDPTVQPEDSYDKMVERAKEKKYPFAYLFDEGQKVFPAYGATKTPHVFLLQKRGADFFVEYIGTIDDNYKDASIVKEKYLYNAIDALLGGKEIAVKETKAIGCSVKVKKS